MTKSYLFRSLGDEIRRFWLARPPQLRTMASTSEFARLLWRFGLHAGSSFERHQAEVGRLLGPLLARQPESATSFD